MPTTTLLILLKQDKLNKIQTSICRTKYIFLKLILNNVCHLPDSVQHGWGVVHIREGQVRDRNAKELFKTSYIFVFKESSCFD